ncbi:MAG: hypothetical protein LW860_01360 [Xanthomonadaceae bacterium]|jgi:hypothetical protein|nr:hypothetical protein [Xanthomonadaceae bacterium]
MATTKRRKAVPAPKAPATAKRTKKTAPARKPARSGDGRPLFRDTRELARLLSRRLAFKVGEVEIAGTRYAAFSVGPQKLSRVLGKVKADKAPLYFVGGGEIAWRSRSQFRVKFREPPLAGGTQVDFSSTQDPAGGFHRLLVEVGGFSKPKSLVYDVFFDGSDRPHDPEIIIDPYFLYLTHAQ